MRQLRDPSGGCPWDREQDWASLVPHTLEEAYEVAEAVAENNPGVLCEELGDLLFQVIFYARIAEEQGLFDFDDVAAALATKLINRHPHVFAGQAIDRHELDHSWEAHKTQERQQKGQHGSLDGVAKALPALVRAVKLQRRAARAGFDWIDVEQILAKVEEELAEVREVLARRQSDEALRHELGDLLLAASNVARFLGMDAEGCLREANDRFEHRFRMMEQFCIQQGERLSELTAERQQGLWQRAKALENK
ncbi:MAG: nucleoside triphosphate pyrophosphohydrolase [Gammaproteobacteria bacterium]|nr:nucleoside triphosphate pyrophosphohydrolase [Gammaproteobacteria bacterium]